LVMEFFNSKRFIVIMLIVLLWAGLSGCSSNGHLDQTAMDEMNEKITQEMDEMDKEQEQQQSAGPTDFTAIAEMLGCVFSPNDCTVLKRKEEQELDR